MSLRAKEIVRRSMRDGETFLRYFEGDNKETMLKVRFMNPALVTDPEKRLDNTDTKVSDGIETNPEDIEAWQNENSSNIHGSDPEDDNDSEEENEDEDLIITENAISKLAISAVGANNENDFIEIINKSNYDIDLAKYSIRLEKAKTALDPAILVRIGDIRDAAYPGGTIVKSQESYLVVRDNASSTLIDLADAIVIRDSFVISDSEQSIFLGSSAISSYNDEDILDLVGFGPEAKYFRGSGPAVSIDDGYVLKRMSFENNNINDFILILENDYLGIEEPDVELEPVPEPESENDLSDIEHQIKWCIANDDKCSSILQKNYYSWFKRVERGIYTLTEVGHKDLIKY
jgi:hypothetical protein